MRMLFNAGSDVVVEQQAQFHHFTLNRKSEDGECLRWDEVAAAGVSSEKVQ